jgi:hypothetical protein
VYLKLKCIFGEQQMYVFKGLAKQRPAFPPPPFWKVNVDADFSIRRK